MVSANQETRQPENSLENGAFASLLVACECASIGYLPSMSVDEFVPKKLGTAMSDNGL